MLISAVDAAEADLRAGTAVRQHLRHTVATEEAVRRDAETVVTGGRGRRDGIGRAIEGGADAGRGRETDRASGGVAAATKKMAIATTRMSTAARSWPTSRRRSRPTRARPATPRRMTNPRQRRRPGQRSRRRKVRSSKLSQGRWFLIKTSLGRYR